MLCQHSSVYGYLVVAKYRTLEMLKAATAVCLSPFQSSALVLACSITLPLAASLQPIAADVKRTVKASNQINKRIQS